MNLKYTSILTLFIFFGFFGNVNAQVLESFTDLPTSSPSSYLERIWTGDDGFTWNAQNARTDQSINGKAITWGNSGTRNIISPSVSGGLGVLSFNYSRAFTGTKARSLEVYINSSLIENITVSPTSNDIVNYEYTANIPGDVVVEIRSTGAAQVKLDDLSWTAYAPGTPIINPNTVSISDFSYTLGSGPSDAKSFTLSGSDLDESDVTISAPSNFEISETEAGTYRSSITLTAFDGTETSIFVRLSSGLAVNSYSGDITISGGGADDVTVALSGEVVPNFDFTETFETENFNLGSGYSDGNFVGVTGAKWYYVESRDENITPINGDNGIMLRRFSDNSSVTSDTISGGIDEFSVLLRKGFTGSGDRQVELFIGPDTDNLVSYGTSDAFDVDGEIRRFTVSGIDYVGDFVLRIANTTSSQIVIDDISWKSLPGSSVQINGTQGWRMLSFPVTGGTVADISDDTAIQGVTGGDNATMDSNFQIYNSGSDVAGFVPPTDISTPFGDGLGFITYFYNNTEAGSSELPITLDIAGEEPSSDVSVTLNTEGDFLLAGNPFTSNLDLNALTLETGTLNENVTIWDNFASSYVTVDRTAGAIASTWQGFWIEYSTGATNLTIPTSAKTETAATASYFGKANSDNNRSDIKFELISETTSDKAIRLSLRENAILGWDAADATKFQPLLTAYATLGFVGDDKLKSVFSAPYNLDEDVTIPMQLDVVGVSGEFELNWSGMASLPSGFSVMLNDAEEGTSVNLSEMDSYTFVIAEESAEKAMPLSVLNVKDRTTMKAKGNNAERFSMTLSPNTSVSNEPTGSQPEVFKLEQNYPNPFNPTTNISFAVANAGNVEISVYNVMGQKVATVLNENRAAGSYLVTFDASSLSSGIYYYRLQSAGQALTRQMTLIK